MTIQDILNVGGEPAKAAKAFVEASAAFFKTLSENNINLDFEASQNLNQGVDYDAPAINAYQKTYKPITVEEITKANKTMQENLYGENYIAGFMMAVNLIMMARP